MNLKTKILALMQNDLAGGVFSIQLKDMLTELNVLGLTESVLKATLSDLVKSKALVQLDSTTYSYPAHVVAYYEIQR
jgi:hypothetical protein